MYVDAQMTRKQHEQAVWTYVPGDCLRTRQRVSVATQELAGYT